jgi:hypothetical protein
VTRQVAIPCSACGRKFGGQQTLDRHKHIAGDRYECYPNDELRRRGFYRDGWMVWHRGANPAQTSLLGLSETVRSTSPHVIARTTDPETSHAAARAVSYRTGTAKARLLAVYLEEPSGLTDEEAAARVGMDLYQATKRCSDLRRDGAISPIGVRKGRAGLDRQVCTFVAQEATA